MIGMNELHLKEMIAVKLCETFKFQKMLHILKVYKIPEVPNNNAELIFDYIINRLANVNLLTLKKMADQLDIDIRHLMLKSAKPVLKISRPVSTFVAMPANFSPTAESKTDSPLAKAFISHSDPADKEYAIELKDALIKYNIEAFVSSKDLRLGDNFPERIQEELNGMDFFIALYSTNFSESPWCNQESGFAFATGVEIFAIMFEGVKELQGFIGRYNAVGKTGKSTQQIVQAILDGLKGSKKTNTLYSSKIAPKVKQLV